MQAKSQQVGVIQSEKEVRVVFRRFAFVVVAAVTLAAISGSLALAQSGVRGTAAIYVSNTNVGTLSINVAKVGQVLNGSFRYTEVCPVSPSNRPVASIYSTRLTSIDVRGNFATVKAIGFWNGMLSDLLVEVLDDNPSGDWYHIRAVPIDSPLPVLYEAAGGVFRGDLVVFGAPPTVGRAFGQGTISFSANTNVGKFQFKAQSSPNGVVEGSIYYAEYTPGAAIVTRPKVTIYVPAVQMLFFPATNVAVLKGRGTMNGRPAEVELKATDNRKPTDPASALPDFLYIKAVVPVAASIDTGVYEAFGPVRTGDIVVQPAIP
jgi:hypothetical protein